MLSRKIVYDKRRAHLSSLILTNQLTRDEALKILDENLYPVEEAIKVLKVFSEKLEVSEKLFMDIINGENKTYLKLLKYFTFNNIRC